MPVTYIMCCCVTRRTVRLTYIGKSKSAQASRSRTKARKFESEAVAVKRAQSEIAKRRQHFRTRASRRSCLREVKAQAFKDSRQAY